MARVCLIIFYNLVSEYASKAYLKEEEIKKEEKENKFTGKKTQRNNNNFLNKNTHSNSNR